MTAIAPTASASASAIATAQPAALRAPADLAPAARTGRTELGQADFLRLLTTQLQNQDPTQPLDNQAFIAQMAQFATVQNLERVAAGIDQLGERLAPSRIATATSLIGKSVLVPGELASRDATGGISGAIDLPAAVDALVVSIADERGRPLNQLRLGPQPAGLVGFAWDGRDGSGAPVAGERFRVSASAVRAGQAQPAATALYGRVSHVELTAGDAPALGLAGIGAVPLDQVRQVRGS